MKENTYNGWTNYATWRINLEIFDGYESDCEVTADYLQDMAEEIVFADTCITVLAESYARAFMSEVNWHEIAEAINERE